MSERLENLKKARDRMIADRDAHAKVLAAPFDRDKAERARSKLFHSYSEGMDRRASCAKESEVSKRTDWKPEELC